MQSHIHQLILNHDEYAIIFFLKTNPHVSEINRFDKNGMSPLALVAREGLLATTLWLIYSGADVKPNAIKTPLDLALQYETYLNCMRINNLWNRQTTHNRKF